METVKGIPYGMSNFEDVIMQNRYYVDKTMYIPQLEDQANYLIFIRPRRFGKSLLLSMLRSYYDLSQKKKFQQLFGQLWIGKQPTPLQGKYQMLYLDFSKIGGSIDELPQRFDSYSAVQLDDFLNRYREYYTDEFIARFGAAEKGIDKLHIHFFFRRSDYQTGNISQPALLLWNVNHHWHTGQSYTFRHSKYQCTQAIL